DKSDTFLATRSFQNGRGRDPGLKSRECGVCGCRVCSPTGGCEWEGGLFPPFSLSFFLLWLFFLSVPCVLLHLSFFPFTSFSFVLSCCGCFLLWCPLSL